jgi:hypothetical protein
MEVVTIVQQFNWPMVLVIVNYSINGSSSTKMMYSINTNLLLINAVVVKSDKAFNTRCHLQQWDCQSSMNKDSKCTLNSDS